MLRLPAPQVGGAMPTAPAVPQLRPAGGAGAESRRLTLPLVLPLVLLLLPLLVLPFLGRRS
jgi:hypothetical protein